MRILIVGAGPTGLTAGLELARRNIETTIIDKRPEGSTLSRAVGILPRSLDILEPSGVTGKLIDEGIQISKVRAYTNGQLIAEIPIQAGEQQHRYGFILALAQDRTEAHLAEAYRQVGGTIRYACELAGFEQEGSGVVAHYSDGTSTNCDFLIGADGVRSTVRAQAGIGFAGHELGDTWSIADVDAPDWQNPGMFTICRLSRGRVVVVVPLEAERYRVVASTDDALRDLPLPLVPTNIRRAAQFTISVRQATRYVEGRVAIAGDAAHCHSPVGGRGMNLGIADAAELARCIAGGSLEGYEGARMADAAHTIALSERVRKTVQATDPFSRLFVSALLKAAANFSIVRKRLSQAILYG